MELSKLFISQAVEVHSLACPSTPRGERKLFSERDGSETQIACYSIPALNVTPQSLAGFEDWGGDRKGACVGGEEGAQKPIILGERLHFAKHC